MKEEKLDELLNELYELLGNNEDHSEDIEKAKKSINRDLEHNPKAIMYVSPSGTLFAGRLNHLLALIAMVFDKMSEDDDVTVEMLTTAFMAGMTKGENTKESRETVNKILEQMKKFI